MSKTLKYGVLGCLLGFFAFSKCDILPSEYSKVVTDTVRVSDTIVVGATDTVNYVVIDTVLSTIIDTIKGEKIDTVKVTITETIKITVPCYISDLCAFIPIDNLEMPAIRENDEIVSHIGYSLLFNDAHKQPDWVAYILSSKKTIPVVARKNNFRPDPAVKTGTAVKEDYANSGFDRGHLAPCADMRWSQQAMDESFFFSNMSPQVPALNQVTWEKLEELVRVWAKEYDTLYIATGPVLRDGLPAIADVISEDKKEKYKPKNKVTVPEYYYKVILNYTSKEIKGIGFIVPNQAGLGKAIETIQSYAVTIDSVQNLTGINFFYQLPKVQEECAEKNVCISCWKWK